MAPGAGYFIVLRLASHWQNRPGREFVSQLKILNLMKSKSTTSTALLVLGLTLLGVVSPKLSALGAEDSTLRPPAVPLVACDPYFSIWSAADKLTDTGTTHWTGKPNRLESVVTIDGKKFRVLGTAPADVPALPQISLQVLPTRTIYTFAGGGVDLTLTFMTPMLPADIDLLSRPVTYVTYEFRATDEASHKVAIDFDASAELTVNQGRQEVLGSVFQLTTGPGPLVGVKVGSVEQAILAKKGDDLRIDWGHLYLAAPKSQASSGYSPRGQHSAKPLTQAGAGETTMAWLAFKPFKVSAKSVSRWLMLAYDDVYSIQYMKKNLRPYWRRNGWEAADLLKASAQDYRIFAKDAARRSMTN